MNAPNCEGAILIGPLRLNTYSIPILALPHQLLASVLSVCTPCTLKTDRICKWSCKLAPTPGKSITGSIPCSFNKEAGPKPDSCKICGEPMLPAHNTTACLAVTCTYPPAPVQTSTPLQRCWPSASCVIKSLETCALDHNSKLGRA